MKLFGAILISVFLLSSELNAQTLDWAVQINTNSPNGAFRPSKGFQSNNQNEVLFAGPDDPLVNYGSQWFGPLSLQLFNDQGNVIVSVIHSGQGSVADIVSFGDYFYLVGQFKDSLQFVGQAQMTRTGPSNVIGDFIAKVHRNGTVSWSIDLETVAPQLTVQALDVDMNGVLHLAAWDWSGFSSVYKMDGMGAVLSTWGMPGIPFISSIDVNNNGTVAIAGSCADVTVDFNGTSVQNTRIGYNTFAAQFNSNGALLWSKFLIDITCPAPLIVLDEFDNTYWTGQPYLEDTLDGHIVFPTAWVYSMFVAKVSPQGIVQWIHQAGPTTSGSGDGTGGTDRSMIPYGSDFLFAGFTRGSLDWGNGFMSNVQIPGQGLFIERFDPQGSTQNLIIEGLGDTYPEVLSLCSGINNDFYALVSAYDTLHIQGQTLAATGFNTFLTKWSGMAQEISEHNTASVSHYPDPALDRLIVEGISNKAQIRVFDLMGRVVLEEGYNGAISLEKLNAGTYLLHVVEDETLVYRSSFRVIR